MSNHFLRKRRLILLLSATVLIAVPYLLMARRGSVSLLSSIYSDTEPQLDVRNDTKYEDGRLHFLHDFGAVDPGSNLKYTFSIKNTSDSSWELGAIETTCSCTVAKPASALTNPGEEVIVPVTYRAPRRGGSYSQQVTLAFKGESIVTIVLQIRATIVPPATASVKEINFGKTKQGAQQSFTFEFFNNSEKPWQSLRIKANAPWLAASVAERPADQSKPRNRQRWQVTVTADTTRLEAGNFDTSIVIAPDAAGLDQITIPVMLRIASPVEVFPTELFVGEVSDAEAAISYLMLRFADRNCPSNPDQILLSHNLGAALNLTTEQSGPNSWRIKARFDARRAARINNRLEGVIEIRFTDPGLGTIKVPFFGKWKSSPENY